MVPELKQARRRSILSTSSNAGVVGYPNETAYYASKFRIEGLSRALTKELTPFGTAVNTITPGTVRTEMSVIALNAEQTSCWQGPTVISPMYTWRYRVPTGITVQYVDAWAMAQALQAQGWMTLVNDARASESVSENSVSEIEWPELAKPRCATPTWASSRACAPEISRYGPSLA